MQPHQDPPSFRSGASDASSARTIGSSVATFASTVIAAVATAAPPLGKALLLAGVSLLWGSLTPALRFLYLQDEALSAALLTALFGSLAAAGLLAAAALRAGSSQQRLLASGPAGARGGPCRHPRQPHCQRRAAPARPPAAARQARGA
jgi:hypothetical protein